MNPKSGKVYALTGGPGAKCISNGNTWAESEVPRTTLELEKELNKLARRKKKTPGDGWAKLRLEEMINERKSS